jgi:hypothetical protein
MIATTKPYIPRRGHIVAVEFFDHVNGADEALHFVVYGRIASTTRRVISLDSWDYAEDAAFDGNVERHTIVRAAITKITRLVEVK